jgi:hypothetical protein
MSAEGFCFIYGHSRISIDNDIQIALLVCNKGAGPKFKPNAAARPPWKVEVRPPVFENVQGAKSRYDIRS